MSVLERNYRLFWSGKTKRVRKAVEDYFHNPDRPWKEVASANHISEVALRNNVKRLEYLERVGRLTIPRKG